MRESVLSNVRYDTFCNILTVRLKQREIRYIVIYITSLTWSKLQSYRGSLENWPRKLISSQSFALNSPANEAKE